MPKPVFTPADIAAWESDLDSPPPAPTELDWPSFADITAFKGGALTAGVALRLKTRDATTVDIRLNAVAARELAAWLLHAGQQAGWIDQEGNITAPLADLDG